MIDGWIHAWTRSRKQWMRKSWLFTVSSNMANDSFNLFVSSFVSFSINGLKEKCRRKVDLYLFLSTHREWESFLCRFLSSYRRMLSDATLTPSFFWLKFLLRSVHSVHFANSVYLAREILIRKMMELKLRQKSSSYNY